MDLSGMDITVLILLGTAGLCALIGMVLLFTRGRRAKTPSLYPPVYYYPQSEGLKASAAKPQEGMTMPMQAVKLPMPPQVPASGQPNSEPISHENAQDKTQMSQPTARDVQSEFLRAQDTPTGKLPTVAADAPTGRFQVSSDTPTGQIHVSDTPTGNLPDMPTSLDANAGDQPTEQLPRPNG
jgi:hypothetical protein